MGAIANFIINSKTIYTLYKKGQLRCLFDKMTSEMLKRCGFFVFFLNSTQAQVETRILGLVLKLKGLSLVHRN